MKIPIEVFRKMKINAIKLPTLVKMITNAKPSTLTKKSIQISYILTRFFVLKSFVNGKENKEKKQNCPTLSKARDCTKQSLDCF